MRKADGIVSTPPHLQGNGERRGDEIRSRDEVRDAPCLRGATRGRSQRRRLRLQRPARQVANPEGAGRARTEPLGGCDPNGIPPCWQRAAAQAYPARRTTGPSIRRCRGGCPSVDRQFITLKLSDTLLLTKQPLPARSTTSCTAWRRTNTRRAPACAASTVGRGAFGRADIDWECRASRLICPFRRFSRRHPG